MSTTPSQKSAAPLTVLEGSGEEVSQGSQQADQGEDSDASSDSWRLRDKLDSREEEESKPQPSKDRIKAAINESRKLMDAAEARAQIPPPEDNPSVAEQLSAREGTYILADLLLAPILPVVRPNSDTFNLGPKATRALLQREVWLSLMVETPNFPKTLAWKVKGLTQPFSWEHGTPIHLLDEVVECVNDVVSAVLPTEDDNPTRATDVEAALRAFADVGEAVVVGDGAQAVYAFTTPITESDAAVAPPVANLEKNLDKFSNAAEKKVVVLDAFPELPTSLSEPFKSARKEDVQNTATKGDFFFSQEKGDQSPATEALAEQVVAALDP